MGWFIFVVSCSFAAVALCGRRAEIRFAPSGEWRLYTTEAVGCTTYTERGIYAASRWKTRTTHKITGLPGVGALKRRERRARAPVKALALRGESPRQAEASPVRDRRLLRRGDTGWGAAGGELPVRNHGPENMNNVNSIRPAEGTSLRALCEVRSAARASEPAVLRLGGAGDRDRGCVRKQTVGKGNAAPPSEGGWRQNGRQRKRATPGDPPVPGGALGQQSAPLAGGSQSVRSSEEAGNDRGAKGTQEGGKCEDQKDGSQTNASARKG